MKIRIKIDGGCSGYKGYNKLRGCIHKWLNDDNLHRQISLYSFSWIKEDHYFFFSSPKKEIVEKLIAGMKKDNSMFSGLHVVSYSEVDICVDKEVFNCVNPFHVKENNNYLYYQQAGKAATRILNKKISLLGIKETCNVEFHTTGVNKMFEIHDIKIKCFKCPVTLTGSERVKKIAVEVGIGNLTGCGFGNIY